MVSEMPELGGICQRDLHTERGTLPRERRTFQAERLEEQRHLNPLSPDMEATRFGVGPVGFWSCFGTVFSHYAPIPLCSVPFTKTGAQHPQKPG